MIRRCVPCGLRPTSTPSGAAPPAAVASLQQQPAANIVSVLSITCTATTAVAAIGHPTSKSDAHHQQSHHPTSLAQSYHPSLSNSHRYPSSSSSAAHVTQNATQISSSRISMRDISRRLCGGDGDGNTISPASLSLGGLWAASQRRAFTTDAHHTTPDGSSSSPPPHAAAAAAAAATTSESFSGARGSSPSLTNEASSTSTASATMSVGAESHHKWESLAREMLSYLTLHAAVAAENTDSPTKSISIPAEVLARWRAEAEVAESSSLISVSPIEGTKHSEPSADEKALCDDEPPPLPPHPPVEIIVSTDAELEAVFQRPRVGWRNSSGNGGGNGNNNNSSTNNNYQNRSGGNHSNGVDASSSSSSAQSPSISMDMWAQQQAVRVILRPKLVPATTLPSSSSSEGNSDGTATTTLPPKAAKTSSLISIPYALLSMPTTIAAGRYIEIVGLGGAAPPSSVEHLHASSSSSSASSPPPPPPSLIPIVGSLKVAKGATLALKGVVLSPKWAMAKAVRRALVLAASSSSSSVSSVTPSAAARRTLADTLETIAALRRFVGLPPSSSASSCGGGSGAEKGTAPPTDVIATATALEAFWARNTSGSTTATGGGGATPSLSLSAGSQTPLALQPPLPLQHTASADIVSSTHPCLEVTGAGAMAYVTGGSILAGGRDGVHASSGGRAVLTGGSAALLCLRGVYEGHRCSCLSANAAVIDNKFQFVLLGTYDPIASGSSGGGAGGTSSSNSTSSPTASISTTVSGGGSGIAAGNAHQKTAYATSQHQPFAVERAYLLRAAAALAAASSDANGGSANSSASIGGTKSESGYSRNNSAGNSSSNSSGYPNKVHKFQATREHFGMPSSHVGAARQRERMGFLADCNVLSLNNNHRVAASAFSSSSATSSASPPSPSPPLSPLSLPPPLSVAHFCYSYNPVTDTYADLFASDGSLARSGGCGGEEEGGDVISEATAGLVEYEGWDGSGW